MQSRLRYYLSSIPTLLFGVKNFWILPLLPFTKSGTVHLRNGLSFKVRSLMDAWVIKETCLDRDYEREGTPIRPGWTCIDIGAGLGDFTLFASRVQPNTRVLGFEPFPESFKLLQENIALNRAKNITPLQMAIGKEETSLVLATTGAAVQHSTSTAGELPGSAELISVEAISLEAVFNRYSIERCQFLKIDCEGGEYDILFNTPQAIFDRIDHICMEYHNDVTVYTHLDLIPYLEGMGFTVKTSPNPAHDTIGFLYATR